jgi:hypothetical protein
MRLARLLDDLDDVRISGRLSVDSPVVSLRGFDSTGCEPDDIPVSSVFVQDDVCQVVLIADPLAKNPGLTVSELARSLQALPVSCCDHEVTVTGEWLESEVGWASAQNLGVIAVGVNPVLGAFGVIPWFEGHEGVFEG